MILVIGEDNKQAFLAPILLEVELEDIKLHIIIDQNILQRQFKYHFMQFVIIFSRNFCIFCVNKTIADKLFHKF